MQITCMQTIRFFRKIMIYTRTAIYHFEQQSTLTHNFHYIKYAQLDQNTGQQKKKIRGEWDFSIDSKPILTPEFRYNLRFSLARLVYNQKQINYLILNLIKKMN